MDILPVNNSTRIGDNTPRDHRQQQQKKQPPHKRETFVSGPVYTHDGGLEEEHPPKIDVLV